MNRKQFFKRLGIGVAAVVVTPKILEAKTEVIDIPKEAIKQLDYAPNQILISPSDALTIDGNYAILYSNNKQVTILRGVSMELKQELIDVTSKYYDDGWIRHIPGKRELKLSGITDSSFLRKQIPNKDLSIKYFYNGSIIESKVNIDSFTMNGPLCCTLDMTVIGEAILNPV